jgi:hypothetical protein
VQSELLLSAFGRLWELPEEYQSSGHEIGDLVMRRALGSILSRLVQIMHRPADIGAPCEVLRQFSGDLTCLRPIGRLQTLPQALVEPYTPPRTQPLVYYLLI